MAAYLLSVGIVQEWFPTGDPFLHGCRVSFPASGHWTDACSRGPFGIAVFGGSRL